MKGKIRNYHALYITGVILILAGLTCLFALVGCSSTTSEKKANLSGSVQLVNDTGNVSLDPVDFANVNVALYHTAKLDTVLVNANTSHPNIGVQISQLTEFDHRLQQVVLSTATAGDGSFALNGINPGTYNLVFSKEGWGVKYIYEVDLAEGDNVLDAKSPVVMYPATELSGFISDNYVLQTNHDYLVTDDLSFTGDVTISPGTRIWVNPTRSIGFYHNVITPEGDQDFARISSSDGMYEFALHTAPQIQKFYSLDCTAYATFSQGRIGSVITSFTDLGWHINTSGLAVENMIVRHMKTGLVFQQLNTISISNCNIISSADPELGGISITNCTGINTEDMIFSNCTSGIRQHSSSNANISNCLFSNSSITDIDNLYETTGSVSHCTFERSEKGISTSGRSNTTVTYCVFRTVIGIHNFHQLNWNNSWFTANNNNFYCSQYHAMSTSVFGQVEFEYMNAENNYWNTTNTTEINDKIYDWYDLPGPDPNHPEYTIWAIIDYSPFRSSSVTNAGVDGN